MDSDDLRRSFAQNTNFKLLPSTSSKRWAWDLEVNPYQKNPSLIFQVELSYNISKMYLNWHLTFKLLEAVTVPENLVVDVNGLTLAGLRDLFGGADFAEARMSVALLGCIEQADSDESWTWIYAWLGMTASARECLACSGPDYLGAVRIAEASMVLGVGPARYGDLNSDLPVCISTDIPQYVTCLHRQTVTGLRPVNLSLNPRTARVPRLVP